MGKDSMHSNGVTITCDFPKYATNVMYTYGSVVTHNDQLYQCTVTATKGKWQPLHWQTTTLEKLIDDELTWPED